MQIVVLDGFAFEDQALDFGPLRSLGELTFYPRTPRELIAQRIGEAPIAFTNKCVIDQKVMDACPNLKFIGVFATGYNTIDVEYAAQKGIVVCNAPDYSTDAVAQHVFALILHFYNRAALHDQSVHAGDWSRCPDFFYAKAPLLELADKTIGLIGFGNIGRRVAQIARAFSMNALVYTRTPGPEPADGSLRFAPLETVLAQSDILSVHCPLTPDTRNLLSRDAFARMKPGTLIINTARGPIVDEAALADALNSGKLMGAGVDVVSKEPIAPDNPLLTAKNCVITPHIAWAPLQTRQRLIGIVAENLRQFLNGTPVHQVN